MIDPRAIIDPQARIAENVTIGPFSIIGPEVEIGEGTTIGSYTVIKGPTRIGKDNRIFHSVIIGEDTQDKKYQGEMTHLEIGDRNVIREFATLHRGTAQGGGITRVGNDNLFMAYVHIAHDCYVGNNVIFANNASLAGHVQVDDYVVLGGMVGVYQFCRLGAHSFAAGGSMIVKDVPPFIKVSGYYAKPFGINVEGLKRRGFSDETITNLKRAYKIIYRENLVVAEAIKKLENMLNDCPEIQLLIELLQNSKRGIVRGGDE